jgi:hypothetical protein
VGGAPGAYPVAEPPEIGGFGLVFAMQGEVRGTHEI